MPKGTPPPDAMTHGFDVAFRLGALSMLIASIIFVLMVNIDRHHLGRHDEADGPSPLEQALFEGATGEI